ncbi:MAG: lysylphosphatidylglycerol synthase transmembrane domain-containing protein [Mediterranea sp.]|nr:lysylphosphatidylglycerol synthase transmembrane domain-containing protein [Mediterranea sp.]
MNKLLKKIVKVIFPLFLGAFILYWVYRDFDFSRVEGLLLHEMEWGWMVLSLVAGVMSHLLRGWRWCLTLEPLGEQPRRSTAVDAIFISYAGSLLLPRVGEVTRCGVLARYDGVPFARSLGTVVTERLVDMLCMALITGVTFVLQMPLFMRFFNETGIKIPSLLHLVTSPWFYVALCCVGGVVVLLCYLVRMLSFFERVKGIALDVWQGVLSLRKLRHVWLFVAYTLGIWLCYYLHFYLTFFCFGFSAGLSMLAGLVMFVGGTFAVLVPTPNGAGPWHFAVITMMMLYGVSAADASLFALVVHAVQTLLVVLLGVVGWMHLQWRRR